MKNRYIVLIVICTVILFWPAPGFALNEDTHKAINEHVAQNTVNGFILNNYLIDNLGYRGGAKEVLSGYDADGAIIAKTIFWWLGYGGIQEDRPGSSLDYATNKPIRSANHFHNPLKPWSDAGLNDFQYSGESSILWAQDSNQVVGGQWSWQTARSAFYLALITPDQAIREKYFAKTFRAVGQQMHLVQDASVPEHVRNSAHLLPAYEGAVLNFMQNAPSYGNLWNNLLLNPITFDQSLLSISAANTSAPVPISRIIDADVYLGDNPGITTTLYGSPQPVGLAEYTNANYVSKDTMFTKDALHNFPYPRLADTILWTDTNKRTYIRKVGSGDVVNHLAVKSRLWDFLWRYLPNDIEKVPAALDDECYKEYAQNLIPRAVGYSAGLLNYFFRGTLEISPSAQNVYAITDGSQTPFTDIYGNQHQVFTMIKAKIRNTTPNETAGAGMLHAVAMYKMRTDYQPDLSGDLIGAYPDSEDEFTYSVSAAITIESLDAVKAAEYTFDFSAKPIPAGVTDLYLQVVFKGTIGNEADNAIAVGMQDLAEPAHHGFWNLSDMFSLDYHLYTEDTIRNTPALKGLVDLMPPGNPNGILNESGEPYISPYPMTYEIAYINQSSMVIPPPVARVANLQPGKHIRLIVIQDRDQPIIVRSSAQLAPRVITIYDKPCPDVTYQSESDGYYYYTAPLTYRHGSFDEPLRFHLATGVLNCYPKYMNNYCWYPDQESDSVELEPTAAEILFGN